MTACFLVVRTALNAAPLPVQAALCIPSIAPFDGLVPLLHRLPPLALAKVWPRLDR